LCAQRRDRCRAVVDAKTIGRYVRRQGQMRAAELFQGAGTGGLR
jgi:hypothetical protein